ncbi:DUF6543 domain-containing protein [Pseudomonas sp.]|uniref:dermonecrotic toxin domain-containing protein n=1 Tax=Pseudomonas sp. TaxID=306 RepID=UPI001B27A9CF|nr:DUF6543 domain-containing protein [Pseudomonas sp.]MBO9548563.1 hypothetical protein [Pseudomonas sp.]
MNISQDQYTLIEQAGQDQIIARRLPGWLCSARPEHLTALRQALNGSLDCRYRLAGLLALGCPLQQIVVLDVRDETFAPIYTSTQRVLVYIPGDPHGPWSAHESLQHFARKVLGQRLRNVDYRQFFARFVRHRDSHAFFSQVVAGYDDLAGWANIDLGEHMEPLGVSVQGPGRHARQSDQG